MFPFLNVVDNIDNAIKELNNKDQEYFDSNKNIPLYNAKAFCYSPHEYLVLGCDNTEFHSHNFLMNITLSDDSEMSNIYEEIFCDPKDIEAVNTLSIIADVDYSLYGMDLLKSGTSLEGMTKEDVLYNDYKLFTVNDKNFAIGQFFTINFDDIEKELDGYVEVLDKVALANNYSLVALYVTDIIKNGSYVIYNSKSKNIIDTAYQNDISEGEFIENCLSRKKHVGPVIMQVLEN